MEAKLKQILERTRDLSFTFGVRSMSMDDISRKLGITKKTLYKYVSSKTDLIEKLLEFERKRFENIFTEHNFEGINAIDILITVSSEIAGRFKDVNPALTFDLKKYYPDVYNRHIEERKKFIFEKIKINLTKGINQGIYREDLSIELIARLYIARLMDIHNPEYFPPEEFSFEVLFDMMFESFIRGIAKPEAVEYFEKQYAIYKEKNNELKQ